MLSTLSGTDLVRACQILFSPEKSFSLSFVKSLDASILKNAFRKKALETHPDRAKALGREEDEQAKLFRQVIHAYEVLLPVAEKSAAVKNPRPENVRSGRSGKPGEPFRQAPLYYRGIVPRYRLRIGHYLYYSGIISWQSLIQAVTFQMRTRPRYGEIAVTWNIISRDELFTGLRIKPKGEKIGEYLMRCGTISGFQHLAIMGKQRKLHCLFGEYFVIKGILSRRQVDIAVRNAMQHNRAMEKPWNVVKKNKAGHGQCPG